MTMDNLPIVRAQSIKWLGENGAASEQLSRSLMAIQFSPTLVPETTDTMFAGQWLPFLESDWSIRSSVSVALDGFYGMARRELRVALELWGLALVFVTPQLDKKAFRAWLHGRSRIPNQEQLRRSLLSHPNFVAADERSGWPHEHRRIMDDLNRYVHPRGLKVMKHGPMKGNVPEFKADDLQAFIDDLTAAASLMVFLLCVLRPSIVVDLPLVTKFGANPPVGGFLGDAERDAVLAVLSDSHLECLKAVYENDEEAKAEAEWIRSLEDLSDDAVDWSFYDSVCLFQGGADLPATMEKHLASTKHLRGVDARNIALGVEDNDVLFGLHAIIHCAWDQTCFSRRSDMLRPRTDVSDYFRPATPQEDQKTLLSEIRAAHDRVAAEIQKRGFRHNSTLLDPPDWLIKT